MFTCLAVRLEEYAEHFIVIFELIRPANYGRIAPTPPRS